MNATHCFEVLVPYHDSREARRTGHPVEARFALLVNIWAPDVKRALDRARERFFDHRFRSGGSARIAAGGPVALRVLAEGEAPQLA